MKYFKNTELAKLYNVSEKSIRNWIDAAQAGKLDLQLHEENGKEYIANLSKNILLVEQLVEKGKKYKNSRAYKVVTPTKHFYELYSPKEIFDIISSLDIYREIPLQYSYFDGGADYWNKYANRLSTETAPNMLTSILKLLNLNRPYLDNILYRYKRVNVIDIGAGNGLPVKELLEHLLERDMLGRYIALDISGDMLKIAKQNMQTWFGDKVTFEGYQRDINYDRFADILSIESIKKDAPDTINVALLVGGTLENLRSPEGALKVIHDSLGKNDLLIEGRKLDTESSRRYFDFNHEPGKTSLANNHRLILDMLNIDESFYDIEMGYNEDLKSRYINTRLKIALTIKFEFEGGERLVELNKDDTILLWRYWHKNPLDIIKRLDLASFNLLQASSTDNQEYFVTVSRIKSESESEK
jgi:SAM-dependent methyltransferase